MAIRFFCGYKRLTPITVFQAFAAPASTSPVLAGVSYGAISPWLLPVLTHDQSVK